MESRIMTARSATTARAAKAWFSWSLFALTIPAANWLIGHVGTACVAPHGPCVLPVAPGLMAPSGVMMVGVALVLRDLVQRRLGHRLISALAIVCRRCSVGAAGAAGAGPGLRRRRFCCRSLPISPSTRRWRGAVWSPPWLLRAFAGLVVDFDRLPLARLRLARLSGRTNRRQGLDGAAVDPVRRLAAPPRRAARHRAGMILSETRGERMSDALFDILRKVTTATITTMLLKKGIRRCWMNGPKPLVAGGERLVGPAFTLRFVPVREDSGDAGKLGAARSRPAPRSRTCRKACIAVADAMGVPSAGIFGDILCARMKKRNVTALVTDGVMRDRRRRARRARCRCGAPASPRRPRSTA